MSSPIHHAEDLDPALVYAPPWAREEGLQHAERPAALPAEQQSPPRPLVESDREFYGDRAMLRLTRRLSLDPDLVPAPPLLDDTHPLWPIAVRLCVVTAVAALLAWGAVSVFGGKPEAKEAVVAAAAPPLAARRVAVVHLPVPVQPTSHQRAVTGSERAEPMETSAPPAASDDLPATTTTSRPLSEEEIATLLKRGKDLLANGDLSSARLLFRRAAEAGSADAALALGATFDPHVIAQLGAIGAEPDVARARKWYQKAQELGSNTASQQLAQLPQ